MPQETGKYLSSKGARGLHSKFLPSLCILPRQAGSGGAGGGHCGRGSTPHSSCQCAAREDWPESH